MMCCRRAHERAWKRGEGVFKGVCAAMLRAWGGLTKQEASRRQGLAVEAGLRLDIEGLRASLQEESEAKGRLHTDIIEMEAHAKMMREQICLREEGVRESKKEAERLLTVTVESSHPPLK